MASPQVDVVIRNLTLVGEGPHYSSGGFLYYVDITGMKIGRYDTKSGKNIFIEVCLFRENHVQCGSVTHQVGFKKYFANGNTTCQGSTDYYLNRTSEEPYQNLNT